MTRLARWGLRASGALLLLLGIGLAIAPAGAQQRVGINSAVNPNAMGIPPGGVPRRLVLGQDVVFNERITTEAEGQTQVLFVDESTLSVGPNANMVIDRFVYDPNAGAGKLAASLTRGIFRFVGGKLSKQANGVSMRTPAATIGIRGGVMLVNVRPGCTGPVPGAGSGGCNALEVIFVYGKGVTVTGLTGASQTLTRPGFEVTVAAPGAAPSDPHPAPPGATEALLAQLDGRPGGNGGAPIVPTEVMVTESGIANVISANIAASIQAADRTQPLPPQPHSVSPTVELTQLNNQNVSVPAATATPVGGGSALPVAEFFTSPTPSGTAIPTALLPTTPSETLQIAAATIPRPITTPVITPPAITPPAIPVATPPVATPPGIPPVVIPPVVIPPVVTPPVIAPLVTISGVTGNFFMNGGLVPYTGGMVANGEFSASTASGPVSFPVTAGSGYTSPDNTFFYAGLTTANQPNPGQPSQGAFVYGGKPVNASFYQANSTSSRVLAFALPPVLASSFLNALPAGLAAAAYNSPLFLATPANSTFSTTSGGTKALQASLAVSGSGPGQSSAIAVLVGNVFNASLNGKSAAQPIINGIIHGSYLANAGSQPIRIYSPYVTPADGVGNSFYGGNGISGFVVSNGNCCGPGEVASNAYATNTVTGSATPYQFVVPAIVPTTTPSVPAGANTPQQNLTGYFGGIMTKEPGTGAGSPTPYALSGTANITTTAANGQVAATLAGSDPLTAGASGVNSMILAYGSTATGATNARIAYVNDKLFAVMENPGAASSVNNVAVPVTDTNSGSNIYLVTATAAPVPTSLLSNGLCSACQYLQWGYWGGELDTPQSGSNPARTDVGHINFWVAGAPPTPAADISALAGANFSGTYNGNLIGTVVSGGSQYLASGGLQAVYHFATQSGSFTVSHYDTLPTFTVSGAAPLAGSSYAFKVNNVPGIAGAVNGSFYGPMAAETGGNFAFTKVGGTPYLTSGIFAAKR
ncbi:MAG: FecR domain-containing protein [Stellaceae bacterium]